ncbi:Crp/Fnr family transcriptional regulator [Actinophytocola sp. NPDC049390]|uniref:Crp/Fnr family transcriptional regulator n=1 Tax=Actinophytocola sp. NPDC049390 TaxID=3363894 RepID=UPI0037B055D0
MQQGVRARHEPGQLLLRQGDPGGWILLSLSGRLKVIYAEPDGRDLVLGIRGPGDLVGEMSEREGFPRMANVTAIEPGITSRMSDLAFTRLVQRLGVGSELNRYIVGKLRASAAHAWQLAHHTTPARLADFLQALVEAAGPDHSTPTTIPMSQVELASALGLARSAVTPVLAEWKAAGIIGVGRGKLQVVDVTRLAEADVSSSGQ